MFCPSCGKEIPDQSSFCLACGKPVHAGGTPPSSSTTARRWPGSLFLLIVFALLLIVLGSVVAEHFEAVKGKLSARQLSAAMDSTTRWSPADTVYAGSAERGRALIRIRQIKAESGMLLADYEAYQIYMAVRRTRKVPGDLAEVGVYRGGSARLICEVKGDTPLHLFDTFEGIPEVGKLDVDVTRGQFKADFEAVKNYLKDCPNTYFYKGWFPQTAGPIENRKFSFVHLDVDTYQSTLDSLKFFYPRMNPGGVIMSHDYVTFAGVRTAVDQFFADKPEPVFEMPGSQCLIIRLRSTHSTGSFSH